MRSPREMEIISVSERRSGSVVRARVEDVTYVELLLLSGLNRTLFGEALDDGDGLIELGFGHVVVVVVVIKADANERADNDQLGVREAGRIGKGAPSPSSAIASTS